GHPLRGPGAPAAWPAPVPRPPPRHTPRPSQVYRLPTPPSRLATPRTPPPAVPPSSHSRRPRAASYPAHPALSCRAWHTPHAPWDTSHVPSTRRGRRPRWKHPDRATRRGQRPDGHAAAFPWRDGVRARCATFFISVPRPQQILRNSSDIPYDLL